MFIFYEFRPFCIDNARYLSKNTVIRLKMIFDSRNMSLNVLTVKVLLITVNRNSAYSIS